MYPSMVVTCMYIVLSVHILLHGFWSCEHMTLTERNVCPSIRSRSQVCYVQLKVNAVALHDYSGPYPLPCTLRYISPWYTCSIHDSNHTLSYTRFTASSYYGIYSMQVWTILMYLCMHYDIHSFKAQVCVQPGEGMLLRLTMQVI